MIDIKEKDGMDHSLTVFNMQLCRLLFFTNPGFPGIASGCFTVREERAQQPGKYYTGSQTGKSVQEKGEIRIIFNQDEDHQSGKNTPDGSHPGDPGEEYAHYKQCSQAAGQ